jgi:putative ABC transport system ATP-binding protein
LATEASGGQGEIIVAEHLTKQYRMDKVIVNALNDVSMRIERGTFVSIIGPSGSGKSTLLHMLSALDRPTSGTVRLDGEEITKASDGRLAVVRGRKVGFVFQFFNLFPTMSAQENVEFPMMIANVGDTKRRRRARELLELVGLGDRCHHTPAELSGGQRQRVAIARALANDPKIILADEPTGNLDSVSTKEIIALLRRLAREQRKTIVIVTHDHAVSSVTDRIIRLHDGRVAEDVANEQAVDKQGETHGDAPKKPSKKRARTDAHAGAQGG